MLDWTAIGQIATVIVMVGAGTWKMSGSLGKMSEQVHRLVLNVESLTQDQITKDARLAELNAKMVNVETSQEERRVASLKRIYERIEKIESRLIDDSGSRRFCTHEEVNRTLHNKQQEFCRKLTDLIQRVQELSERHRKIADDLAWLKAQHEKTERRRNND